MDYRWIFPDPHRRESAYGLAKEMSIPFFVAQLLVGKGFEQLGQIEQFLNPRLQSLGDPFELEELQVAVARLDLALRNRQRIVLYGDYDVDGVSSLALMARVLRAYGGDVRCFLPMRMEEGYGLSEAGMDRCFSEFDPELLVAIDCGTNALSQIAEAKRRGVDVLVLDHHESDGIRPDCFAIVNPKMQGKYTYLCSAGVVFKVCHGLLKYSPTDKIDLRDYLDLVALATLADLVPVIEENRTLVHYGLRRMASTRWCGLAALMDVSGVRPPVRAGDVGFRLGPRINAAGRLTNAHLALELLLTDHSSRARTIATELDVQNRERQGLERMVAQDAQERVESEFGEEVPTSIVVGAKDWHPGVVGIVASRLCRRWHRPALVVGFDENGMGKGSGRSIPGFSLVEALSQCNDLLDAFGGHEMAVGLSIREENFERFAQQFREKSDAMTDADMLVSPIRLDAEIPLEKVDFEMLEAQEMLEPFGMDNSQPVFVSRAVVPVAEPKVLKEKHLRFDFDVDGRKVSAIYFHGAERELPEAPWDLAFRVERNEYHGVTSAQIHVVAIRSSE